MPFILTDITFILRKCLFNNVNFLWRGHTKHKFIYYKTRCIIVIFSLFFSDDSGIYITKWRTISVIVTNMVSTNFKCSILPHKLILYYTVVFFFTKTMFCISMGTFLNYSLYGFIKISANLSYLTQHYNKFQLDPMWSN